jgi:hypothetical protein
MKGVRGDSFEHAPEHTNNGGSEQRIADYFQALSNAGSGVNVGWNQRFKNRMLEHGFLMC